MTKAELQEAERIAIELAKADAELRRTGQAGIDPQRRETMTLAKAVQLFSGTLEVEELSPMELRQRQHESSL